MNQRYETYNMDAYPHLRGTALCAAHFHLTSTLVLLCTIVSLRAASAMVGTLPYSKPIDSYRGLILGRNYLLHAVVEENTLEKKDIGPY